MDIIEVLNRPEYQFIQTNPHLGGRCYLQHLVEVMRMVLISLHLTLIFVDALLTLNEICLDDPTLSKSLTMKRILQFILLINW